MTGPATVPPERLREAARLLREKADAAMPPPWSTGKPRTGYDNATPVVVRDLYVAHYCTPGSVGRALADWLDHSAECVEARYPGFNANFAVAVANALTGATA